MAVVFTLDEHEGSVALRLRPSLAKPFNPKRFNRDLVHMNASSSALRATVSKSAPFTILAGGAIAGTLDLAFAFTFAGMHDASPPRVLQFIASGLLGTNAFAGGWSAGALGAFCHYIILNVATSFY